MPFPGFQDKHAEEPYFTPGDWADWRRAQGDLDGFVCPDSVVLVYNNRTYRSLSEAPDAQPAGGAPLPAWSRSAAPVVESGCSVVSAMARRRPLGGWRT